MQYLHIRNWERWQSWRSDRGQPPWIKIHRCVMRDVDWVALTDAQRGQLVAMWLLAADRGGAIPASPGVLKKLCHLDDEPDLQMFIDHGFIEPGDIVTPSRRQHDSPDKNRVEESRGEEKVLPNGNTRRKAVPFARIVELFHEILPELPACKTLTSTRKGAIRQRHTQEMEGDLENWASFFRMIKRSRFLMGLEPPGPGRSKPFRATLDWVTKAENCAKIIEGKYHG